MLQTTLPRHIAIIMDGNGRWAQARGYPRFYGHVRGAARVKEIVRSARTLGVQALTLYAFSTENWKRPEEELSVLWKILKKYLRREVSELKRQGIRLNVIGEIGRLPPEAASELRSAIATLSGGRQMVLTFALSYGGRAEIVDATRAICEQVGRGQMTLAEISEAAFSRHLSTASLGDLSDVDFLIRTSGEMRISNFLLWQCSYAEFEFPEKYWPDYGEADFRNSLETFSKRKRRYGAV